jgi:hypothetical protein
MRKRANTFAHLVRCWCAGLLNGTYTWDMPDDTACYCERCKRTYTLAELRTRDQLRQTARGNMA